MAHGGRGQGVVFDGLVPPEWRTRGEWLSKASETYGNAEILFTLRAAAQQFTDLRDDPEVPGSGETPEIYLMSSNLTGKERERELLGRLSQEQRRAWTTYLATQQRLASDLRHRLQRGSLRAYGYRPNAGMAPSWIPFFSWHYLTVDHDSGNVARGLAGTWLFVKVIDPAMQAAAQDSRATDEQVIEALRAVYGAGKRPNKPTAYKLALQHLKERGLTAIREHIYERADDAEFALQRNKPGPKRRS